MADVESVEPILDLGLLESAPAWKLSSRFLVHSKVGGRPAWLQPTCLPCSDDLTCSVCESPMVFLLQLYAPIESEPSAFHRTIFVFMCKNPSCHDASHNPPFVVLRNQLCRKNEFYPYDPPPEVATWNTDLIPAKFSSLCRVCGCPGSKKCAGCKKVTYCSKNHQAMDWKERHKQECKVSHFERDVVAEDTAVNSFNLPQWEIIMHEEEDDSSSDDSDHETEEDQLREAEELAKFAEMLKAGKAGSLSNKDVEKYCQDEVGNKDPTFSKFLKVTKREPKQVVRYSRRASPLWISEVDRPSDIPNCEYCGGARVFEFQIMPQLLSSLKLDSLDECSVDWGVLVIYTCDKSCDSSDPAYKKEFICRQFIR